MGTQRPPCPSASVHNGPYTCCIYILTNNPDLTMFSTSASLVNKVANEPNDKLKMIANMMPVNSPAWVKIDIS